MEEIAIIGMGCLFPGAETPDQFWENLRENKELTSLASAGELGRDPDVYFDPTPGTPNKICYQKHGYVRDFQFDSRGYKIKAEELDSLDKLFQHSLYAAGEALKDGDYWKNDEFSRSCGLILGNLSFPSYHSRLMFSALYQKAFEPCLQELLDRPDFSFNTGPSFSDISPYSASTAGFPAITAARSLGLSGPCYSIDAACASALFCLKLASYCLEYGKSDSMLVGCLCSPDHLFVSHGFNVLRAAPPADGDSIPFDSSSQGLSIGHGSAFLLVKSYSKAIRDKDKIYAVIENIGLSNDGGAQHILSPDTAGQLLALERAYANISPKVDYVECHATGTPVGDMVELNTLETFFSEKGKIPLLGANKASLGHLLTASGMVGMIKVLLSLKNGAIPAAIGVKNPLTTKSGLISGKNMALENSSWTKQNEVRRAGVNAFGFGGTNAHLVLREHISEKNVPPTVIKPPKTGEEPLAIVGLGVGFGDISQKNDFAKTIYQGRQRFKPLSPHRWIGAEKLGNVFKDHEVKKTSSLEAAFFDQAEIDCMKMKIPPNMLGLALANHFFMAKIAEQACRDAGGEKYICKRDKMAVIVAWEMEMSIHRSLSRSDISWQLDESLEKANIKLKKEQKEKLETIVKDALFPTPFLEGTTGGIGNLAAARVSSVMGFRGPAFTVASQENSVFKALELAKLLLDSGEAEAALIGSLDMAAGWEAVLWRDLLRQIENKETNSDVKIGEGGGAIIIKPYSKAKRDQNRVYSVINSLEIVQKNNIASLKTDFRGEEVSRACQSALSKAGAKPYEVDYIELHGSGFSEEDKAEKNGLAKAYYSFKTKQAPTIGSVKANIGHTFSSSGMASLIKTSLCLYNRFLPAVPRGEKNRGYLKIWDKTPFQILARSISWPQPEQNRRRMAGVNCLGSDGSYSHLILSEPDKDDLFKAKKFESELKAFEKQNSGAKTFTKILLNGATPIGDILLKPEYMKQFQSKSSSEPTSVANAAPAKIPFVVLSTTQDVQPRDNRPREDKSGKLSFVVLSTKSDKTITNLETAPKSNVIWTREQIVEMTEGRLSNVLGPEYEEIDQYPIRARTPSPPFMFVHRVTKMTAQKDQLKPCLIEWEYDAPTTGGYIMSGMVPAIIPFEASHTLILALSFIRCDRIFKGECKYRALDSEVNIYDEPPLPGQVFTGEVKINSFIKSKNRLLIFYEFNGYVEGRKLFTINANAGFFPKSDLAKAQGLPSKYDSFKPDPKNKDFTPLLECKKTSFSPADIKALQEGDFSKCFGAGYNTRKPFCISSPKLAMLTRVLSVDIRGGLGLGVIIGETDIHPDHWVFKAHFKNDPVMPGTMLVEGCTQLMLFYIYYLGLNTKFKDFRQTVIKGIQSTVRFRGEVQPENTKVQYRAVVKEIATDPENVHIICDAEVLHRNVVIGICDNLSLRLSEI